jgi:hypothetical protein
MVNDQEAVSLYTIPVEIVRSIIEYCSDIDVRRSFGVYAKLNLGPFRDVVTGGRISSLREYGKHREYFLITQAARYSIHNRVQMVERKEQNIMDDAIQVVIRQLPHSGVLQYDIDIYQLLPKTGLPEYWKRETECDFPIGTLGDRYYWNAMVYSFMCK